MFTIIEVCIFIEGFHISLLLMFPMTPPACLCRWPTLAPIMPMTCFDDHLQWSLSINFDNYFWCPTLTTTISTTCSNNQATTTTSNNYLQRPPSISKCVDYHPQWPTLTIIDQLWPPIQSFPTTNSNDQLNRLYTQKRLVKVFLNTQYMKLLVHSVYIWSSYI